MKIPSKLSIIVVCFSIFSSHGMNSERKKVIEKRVQGLITHKETLEDIIKNNPLPESPYKKQLQNLNPTEFEQHIKDYKAYAETKNILDLCYKGYILADESIKELEDELKKVQQSVDNTSILNPENYSVSRTLTFLFLAAGLAAYGLIQYQITGKPALVALSLCVFLGVVKLAHFMSDKY